MKKIKKKEITVKFTCTGLTDKEAMMVEFDLSDALHYRFDCKHTIVIGKRDKHDFSNEVY